MATSRLRRYLDPALWRPGMPADPLGQRDPEFIRAELPLLDRLVNGYHRTETQGLDRFPDGPCLIVGNHNGGVMAPDMFALMVEHWKHAGVDVPAYGLMHDFVFRTPPFGLYLARMGAVPAGPDNAVTLLGRGARVLVYPGGDLDAFRPLRHRNRIIFGGRRGFVRVALRAGAPIVPVVSAGAHESFFVLSDGAELARRSGLKRLTRMEVVPLIAGLPWGLWVGPMFYLPLPVRIRLQILEPIAWPHLTAADAEDDTVVRRCAEQVRATMQSALDRMVAEGGYGLRGRWR